MPKLTGKRKRGKLQHRDPETKQFASEIQVTRTGIVIEDEKTSDRHESDDQEIVLNDVNDFSDAEELEQLIELMIDSNSDIDVIEDLEEDTDSESEEIAIPDLEKELQKQKCIAFPLLDSNRPLNYDGLSERTFRRKRALDQKALEACPMNSITSYMKPKETNENNDEKTEASVENPVIVISEKQFNERKRKEAFEKVELLIRKSSKPLELMKLMVISKSLELQIEKNLSATEAARQAAEILPPNERHKHKTVRKWTKFFVENLKLMPEKRGIFKRNFLFHDEVFQQEARFFLRKLSGQKLNPTHFQDWVNNGYLKDRPELQTKISLKTSHRWMLLLGFKYGKWKKGVYIDGHERGDVVSYRKKFLERFANYRKRTIEYDGEDMSRVFGPQQEPGRPLIVIYHDESTYYANDDGGYGWFESERPPLRKKGQGLSLMVSDFICSCHGFLPGVRELLEAGENREGYWTSDHLVEQLKCKALPIFAEYHPNCDLLFIFDNSSNHAALPEDARVASRMNLNAGGGNVPIMRNGWFIDRNGNRVVQEMFYLDDSDPDNIVAVPKGIKMILKERNLWPRGRFNLSCKLVADHKDDGSCCARKLMSIQPDFLENNTKLTDCAETFSNSRDDLEVLIDFLPKFHCELNPIELCWSESKRHVRKECDYTFEGLKEHVPKSFEHIDILHIRKYYRMIYRYMDLYSAGLSLELAEYANKKYSSHRMIPQNVKRIIEADIASKPKPNNKKC
jgi:hypothetical protein